MRGTLLIVAIAAIVGCKKHDDTAKPAPAKKATPDAAAAVKPAPDAMAAAASEGTQCGALRDADGKVVGWTARVEGGTGGHTSVHLIKGYAGDKAYPAAKGAVEVVLDASPDTVELADGATLTIDQGGKHAVLKDPAKPTNVEIHCPADADTTGVAAPPAKPLAAGEVRVVDADHVVLTFTGLDCAQTGKDFALGVNQHAENQNEPVTFQIRGSDASITLAQYDWNGASGGYSGNPAETAEIELTAKDPLAGTFSFGKKDALTTGSFVCPKP